MKYKRITALVVLLVVAIMTAIFLNDPPIGKVTTDEISDYFRVNKFVKSTIEAEFADTLPKTIPPDAENADYHYLYSCGLVGDPTFYVYLRLEYTEKDKLYEEIRRLDELSPAQSLYKDGEHYLIFAGSEDSFVGYLDDEAHSGVFWYFNIVVIDETNCTIEYSVARYHDSYEKFDRLTETIISVKNLVGDIRD